MKFVSKNSNLRIVLRPGISSNALAGVAGTPGLYVKFTDGIVKIDDEDQIKQMLAHPGMDHDFIAVDEAGEDPFAAQREETEPTHIIQDMKYGHVEGRRLSPNRKTILDPQIKKLVDDLAMQKVNELLPKLVEDTVKKMMDMADAKKSAIDKVIYEDVLTDEELGIGEDEDYIEEEEAVAVKADSSKNKGKK